MIETLRDIVDDLMLAFGSLVYAAQDPQLLKDLLADLGWTVNSVPQPLLDLSVAGSDLVDLIESDAGEILPTHVIDSVKRLIDAINAIHTKPDTDFPSEIDVASFKATIGRDLLDYFIVEHLLRNRYKIGDVLRLAGIIRLVEAPGIGMRQSYVKRQVMWNRIGELITDPAKGFRESFDWNSPTPRLAQAISDFAALLEDYGMHFMYFRSQGDQLKFVNAGATEPFDESIGIDLAFEDSLGAPDGVEAGIQLVIRPPTSERGTAILFLPYARSNGAREIALSDTSSLSIRGDTDFTKGVALILAPRHPPEVQVGFLGGEIVSPAEVLIGLKVVPRPDESEHILIGTLDASRISMKSVTLSAGARLDSSGKFDVFAVVELEDAHVVIKPKPGEADSFLASFLGPDGLSAQVSLGLRISSLTGFHFVGSGGLEASFSLHITQGPIDFQALSIGFKPGTQGADLEVGATLAAKLGPLIAIVDGVGFKIEAKFPDPPTGNLGPVDLGFSFKLPSGIGLSIDASAVVGGGFLSVGPQAGEYSGMLEIVIVDKLTVKATGLLTTGSKGYSLLIIITAEDFKPIPLPLGFRLTGIGGLLAINRTFDEEALRAGLKNQALDSILFPKDPIRNAPQILSNLNKFFPSANGHHLFGPMAKIEWGTPTLVTANVALILELGERLRLLILAQIVAILPKQDDEMICLQMNAIGVIDFDQGTAALDATLHGSRLLKKFTLTGDMALRANWEGSPNFALAIGGFHPAFNPPPNFPKLERLAINLTTGDNPRLRCEAYFALTANTVQFGARAELYAEAIGFSVHGEIGFDVLIQFDPFQFIADFDAQLQLKRGTTNLFKVRVEGALSGPRPLHIKAKATFEVLWWDVTLRIDATLVEGVLPPLPEPVDVLPILLKALGDPGNWAGQLPAGQRSMVTLRAKPGNPTDVLLHPLGTLTVKQNVVPLNMDVSKFGQSAPAGARRFTLSLDDQNQTSEPVSDFFAPAQFFEMRDAEKLSRPSFEAMPAGIRVGSDEIAFSVNDCLEVKAIEFETCIFDKETGEFECVDSPESNNRYKLQQVRLAQQARFGAAANSDLRRTGKTKFRTTMGKYRIEKEGWSIVSTDDLSEQRAPGVEEGKRMSYSQAEQALGKLKEANPAKATRLKILRFKSEVLAKE